MTAPAVSPLGAAWAEARAKAGLLGGTRAHVEYQSRPEDWIVEKLGIPRETLRWSINPGYETHEWDQTRDPLIAVLDGLVAWRNVGVESATTTGKTFLGACIVLWFLACYEDSTVVTVAPKEDQLKLHIWKEIGRLWPRFHKLFPDAERGSLRIRMRANEDAWAAHGFVAGVRAEEVEGSATKAQGFHAEHMLIVFEETPGINSAIMTAFKNTCRAPHNLRFALGNPDHQLDALHVFCQGARTNHVIISAFDHPNVVCDDPSIVPGAVSRQGIEDAIHDAEDDGGTENRLFQSRIRGISPSESVDALIRLEWCESAAERYNDPNLRTGRIAKGVDVAQSEAGDKAAIATGDGACLLNVRAFPCPNATLLGRGVYEEAKREGVDYEHIGVDSVGVGAATVNELNEKTKHAIQALNGGAAPIANIAKGPDGKAMDWVPDAAKFVNLRSQMYWQCREDLRMGQIALPANKKLFRQLVTPRWERQGGKILVESKDDIKKRSGGKSPDEADAVVYWNWVRPRHAVKGTKPPRTQPRDVVEAVNMGNGQPATGPLHPVTRQPLSTMHGVRDSITERMQREYSAERQAQRGGRSMLRRPVRTIPL